jgi:copper chaperone CopZ
MREAFEVEGIHCSSCAKRITDAIVAVQPGAKVGVDIESGTVEVEPATDRARIVQAIADAGYALRGAA